ncbi:MAG: DNA-3-methyladenine glycosylase I [Lachnospiraceae bacterium]|nr:DNA-3-methyladenine glycosylase I [Lachnospiraceae bacterium]
MGNQSINELNKTYHDREWGIPVHDDRKMYEHLILECMQCGLSWDLMLKKRDVIRKCFDDYDYDMIAEYDDKDVGRILNTENMMRSVRKIDAARMQGIIFRRRSDFMANKHMIVNRRESRHEYISID